MIKRLIGQTFIWLVIVGCISYAVAWALGDPTPTILSPYTIQYGNGIEITLYRLNVNSYLMNLQNTLDIPWEDMWFDIPSLYNPGNFADILLVFKETYNAYIWMINMILWIANITIVIPTKILIHPLILTLSLLGINTTKLGLVEIANKIYSTNISIIPYWK